MVTEYKDAREMALRRWIEFGGTAESFCVILAMTGDVPRGGRIKPIPGHLFYLALATAADNQNLPRFIELVGMILAEMHESCEGASKRAIGRIQSRGRAHIQRAVLQAIGMGETANETTEP